MEDDDRESNGFSENDQDEVMEDADGPEPYIEPEEDEEEVDEEEDRENEVDTEDNAAAPGGPRRGDSSADGGAVAGRGLNAGGNALNSNNSSNNGNSRAADGTTVDSAETMEATAGDPLGSRGASAHNSATSRASSANPLASAGQRLRPSLKTITAHIYDIVPTMAAPQATSINALAVTPDLRYWMTGGYDGYIRKYDGAGTINGRQLLTVAQRHPFVDSVVKAGILMSYWENDEPSTTTSRGTDEHIVSPVYSLAIHSNALWLLAGTEGGGINLQSVRHDEGKRITSLQRHTNAVSVLQLAPDEKSVLSGSWDKNIFDWDLNSGHVKRQFDGNSGQISALELRPASGAPIPVQSQRDEPIDTGSTTFSSSNARPLPNGVATVNGASVGATSGDTSTSGASATVNGDEQIPDHESLFGSPGGSLFGGSDAMGGNPFGDDDLSTAVDMTAGSIGLGDVGGDFSQDVDMGLDGGEAAAETLASAQAGQTDTAELLSGRNTAAANLSKDGAIDDRDGDAGDSALFSTDASDASGAPIPSSVPIATSDSARATVPILPQAGLEQANQSDDQMKQEALVKEELIYEAEDGISSQTQQWPLGLEAQAVSMGPNEAPEGDMLAGDAALKSEEKRTTPEEKAATMVYASQPSPTQFDSTQTSETTFFSASVDGTIRIWDRRQSLPVARIGNRPGVPPWCMGACWSLDGNRIYAGRRNGIVEEFDIHKARNGWQSERSLKFPPGSGPITAVRALVNGRQLVCASHDILRLYDLQDASTSKHSSVPFLIIPGPPRPGVISHLYIDRTSRFMISIAGTRGWEGTSTETLIGYEIHPIS